MEEGPPNVVQWSQRLKQAYIMEKNDCMFTNEHCKDGKVLQDI